MTLRQTAAPQLTTRLSLYHARRRSIYAWIGCVPLESPGRRKRTCASRPFSCRLVPVHLAVGRSEQSLVAVAVVRKDGGTDADSQPEVLARLGFYNQYVNRCLQLDSFAYCIIRSTTIE